MTSELELEDRVIFHGNVPHPLLCNYLKSANLLLFPSVTEGLSKTIIEACYLGVPVITTPIGGQKDFLTEGKSVLFVKPKDVETIKNALKTFEQSPELLKQLSQGSKNVFESSFTYDAFVSRFEEILVQSKLFE